MKTIFGKMYKSDEKRKDFWGEFGSGLGEVL